MTSPATARRLWALGEPYHALTYFADECRPAVEETGLRGFWRGYFAMRAAPLGPVGAEVVTATFYNFAPAFVAGRVPEVWQVADPASVLAARLAGVDAAVRRILGEAWPASAAAAETAELLTAAAAAVDAPGRPLAAANAGLPVPAEPHLAVWQSLTTLREHRGDGHNAALLQRGISGVGAHVLAAAAGRTAREWLVRARGWDDDAWTTAAEELAGRSWLAGEELTAEGGAIVAAVEADTDRLAELLAPVRRAVVAAGAWPEANPIGVPDPD